MDPAARATERIGETIAGKYRLERLLGTGGMGAVYEALHEFTQRRVAVKLMHPGFARSAVAAERFLREAQAPSTIGHPGIVEVLDGGRDRDGALYLVLELLTGRTLAQAIAERTLDLPQVGAIGIELLDALQAAHEAGFVHRDIKPENVFLLGGESDAPGVKLLDFGVAGVLSQETKPGLTQAGSVLGTPLYMSPEQAIGRRVDARSDLWSVGAVLYQALSGRAPFGGESFQALVVSIATEEHLPLSVLCPQLPVRVVAVVERALRKDAAQRWQSAAEMAEALRHALEHGLRARGSQRRAPIDVPAVVAARPERPVPDAPPRAARRWLLLAAAVVVLLIAGGVVFAVLPRAPASVRQVASASGTAPALRGDAVSMPAPAKPVVQQAFTRGEPARSESSGAQLPTSAPRAEVASAQPAPVAPVPPPVAVQTAAPQGLAAEALTVVLQQHDSELQRCYEADVLATLMRADAGLAPNIAPLQLDVQLEIAKSGEVTDVTLDGAASAAMRHCASDAIRTWRFPNSAGPTRARFPVVFQPSIIRR